MNTTSRHLLQAVTTAAAALLCLRAAAADSLDALPTALMHGTPDLNVRLRYESVNQHNLADDANAFTARARLGYTTGHWNGFFTDLQFEGVTALGDDQFNSTKNGRTQYPAVPDPSGEEVNQFYLGYAGLPGTVIKYGRQRIVYDDARFVGDVGFRQRQQTYDGLTLTGKWLPGLTFDFAYLTNVDSFKYAVINGSLTKNVDLNATQLYHLSYAVAPWLKVAGYAYLLNFANDAPLTTLNNPTRDTATYGARFTGAIPSAPVKFSYALEYARQTGYAASPSSVQANYYLAEVGAAYWRLTGKLGYEVLGGDGHYAFQTPLATLHAFQGWADQFLTTPATGIDDFYASLGGKVENVKLLAVWHHFDPNDSSAQHYGSEIDLLATRPIFKGLSVTAAYAYYSADHYPVGAGRAYSTSKAWLWLDYRI